MEKIFKYENLAERQEGVKLLEGQELRMLHDNFDSDWKEGEEPRGIMTFTDEPEEKIVQLVQRDLVTEIDNLKVEVEELKRRVPITG